jgi:hypothetical protein
MSLYGMVFSLRKPPADVDTFWGGNMSDVRRGAVNDKD